MPTNEQISQLFDSTVMEHISGGELITQDPDFHRFLPFFKKVAIEHGRKVMDLTVQRVRDGQEAAGKAGSSKNSANNMQSTPASTLERSPSPPARTVPSVPSRRPSNAPHAKNFEPRRRSRSRSRTRSFTQERRPPARSPRRRSPAAHKEHRRTYTRSRSRSNSGAPAPARPDLAILLGNDVESYFILKKLSRTTAVSCERASEVALKLQVAREKNGDKFPVGVVCMKAAEDFDEPGTALLALQQHCKFIKIFGPKDADFSRLPTRFHEKQDKYPKQTMGFHFLRDAQQNGFGFSTTRIFTKRY